MTEGNDSPKSTQRFSTEPDQRCPLDSANRINKNIGEKPEQATEVQKPKRGWRFWTICVSLYVTVLLNAVESTVTSTALPTISNHLNAGNEYVWFVNSFFLTSAAFHPSVAIYTLGSGVSGGATSSAMLIGGRTVQGIGGGGINVLVDTIVSDLVPLRERGNFMGMVFAVFSIGTSLGPVIGGIIVQRTSWRWVFYLNLPIGGVALVCLFMFLHVNYQKEPWQTKLKKIDYFGNALLMTSIVSILIALSWGGALYSWRDWRIILPLVLGFIGIIAFHSYEASPWCSEPMMPPRLFANRTSATALVINFLHSMLIYWVVYFLPLYFQSVKLTSTTRSGVDFLPSAILAIPTAIVAGVLLTKFGRYRPIHFVAFALTTIGLGLFTRLDKSTSDAERIIFQITAMGQGLPLTTTLAAVQVDLPESEVGAATATWAFVRSYGAIWGVSIPAAIFNTQFAKLAHRISDPSVRAHFAQGAAYSTVSKSFIGSLAPQVESEVIGVYSDSLKLVWQVSIAFSGLGFLLVFLEKEIKLRDELQTEYGIKEPTKALDMEVVDGDVGR